MPTTTGKGSPQVQRDRAAHRAAQAVELRIAGYTYARIAAALQFANPSSAKKAVDRALSAETESQVKARDALRKLHNLRIERLIQGLWSAAATKGDVKAAAAIKGLLERQAKLNGLDAPINVQITDKFDAEIEALLAELGAAESREGVQ